MINEQIRDKEVQIDYVVDQLKGIVEKLRAMSPLYEDFVQKQAAK